MGDFVKALFAAQLWQVLVVAGIAFLFLAVAGNISGKIDPGRYGRIGASGIGSVLLLTGLVIALRNEPIVPPPPTPAPTPAPTAATATSCGDLRCVQIADFAHPDQVRGLAFEWSGQRVVSIAGVDTQARVWEVLGGSASPVVKFPQFATSAITALAGESATGMWPCRFAVGRLDGSVELWMSGGSHTGVVDWTAPRRHSKQVHVLAWDARGEFLASAGDDGRIWIWAPASDPEHPERDFRVELAAQHGLYYALAWRPSGGRHALNNDCDTHTQPPPASADYALAAGSGDGSLQLGNPFAGALQTAPNAHAEAVLALAWSPDGLRLASGSLDQTLAIRDPTGALLTRQQLGSGAVNALSWSPDGQLLASGTQDGVVRFWRFQGDKLLRVGELNPNRGPVMALAWSADVLGIGLENTLRLVRVSG